MLRERVTSFSHMFYFSFSHFPPQEKNVIPNGYPHLLFFFVNTEIKEILDASAWCPREKTWIPSVIKNKLNRDRHCRHLLSSQERGGGAPRFLSKLFLGLLFFCSCSLWRWQFHFHFQGMNCDCGRYHYQMIGRNLMTRNNALMHLHDKDNHQRDIHIQPGYKFLWGRKRMCILV